MHHMTNNETSRRSWLKTMGLGVGALLAGGYGGGGGLVGRFGRQAAAAGAEVKPAAGADGVLRVAHITDVHVQPERGGGRGMAACLRHIQSRKDRPSLILNTGDCIMDSFNHDRARTDLQWELWSKVLKDECSLPIEHCLGNHDIWGWNKTRSGTRGVEPQWGKQRGMEALGLDRPYHSFDHGAWHFIMLDSMVPFEEGYRARLDEEQFAWLQADLKSVGRKRPVLVGSHIPLFSPSAIIRTAGEDPALPGRMAATGANSHVDIRRIAELFKWHPNVKLCISGHLHEIDRADYRGVTYANNPAVSGAWWNGLIAERWGEMYTMLELHPDGRFAIEHVDYGWDAEKEQAKEAAPAKAA